MTYELAKQLKDAGFLQPKYSDKDWDTYERMFPNLSELIEACGDGYFLLEHIRGNRWVAVKGLIPISEIGITLEEAVANLWLKLNKII
jgi:hypothetical protein